MKQEDKDLLLRDLSARLPYGVKCDVGEKEIYTLCRIEVDNINGHLLDYIEDKDGFDMQVYLSEVKPYLFPLSSMTDEQIMHAPDSIHVSDLEDLRYDSVWTKLNSRFPDLIDLIDWLNKNHFDYRGLIEKGLALDATGLNIY